MPLSTIPLTDGDGGKRLATAEIVQDGETVSLPRVIVENSGNAAPDTYSLVAFPKTSSGPGPLLLIWGANGNQRRIYLPRVEIQQVKAAQSPRRIHVSLAPLSPYDSAIPSFENSDGWFLTPNTIGSLSSPEPVDPRGPITVIGVHENTYVGSVVVGGGQYHALDNVILSGWLSETGGTPYGPPWFPDQPGAPIAYRYAVRTMRLATDAADFQSTAIDFSKPGQYPMIRHGADRAIMLHVDDDMDGAELMIRLTFIEHEV